MSYDVLYISEEINENKWCIKRPFTNCVIQIMEDFLINIMSSEFQVLRLHIVVIISFQLINVQPSSSSTVSPISPTDVSCYRAKCYGERECDRTLPTTEKLRPARKTIYFVESSCAGGLKSRAACSVESAAHSNPNWNIIVLFVGPLKDEFWNLKTYTTLNSMPNVHFYRVNLNEYAKGTPLEHILDKELSYSKYPVVHCADILRLLTLFKYGGLYLDLDMIVMMSFDSLPENFIARQRPNELGSGIIAASTDGIGFQFLNISISDLALNYDPWKWAGNTNDLYSRSLSKICGTMKISRMNAKKCKGFHVLDSAMFYPIDWAAWTFYYTSRGVVLPPDTGGYTHHLWNSRGSQVSVPPGSYFARIARKYCPQVYRLYGRKFGHSSIAK